MDSNPARQSSVPLAAATRFAASAARGREWAFWLLPDSVLVVYWYPPGRLLLKNAELFGCLIEM